MEVITMEEELKTNGILDDEPIEEAIITVPPTATFDEDSLPKPLAVLRIHTGENNDSECIFYILGTAHVSRQSCDDAASIIQIVQPDIVLVELCPERQPILQMEKMKEPSLSEALAEIRSGRATPFQGIYSWLLARVGKGLDVMPGEEFRVAVREAQAVDACVVLGDRPLNITLARVWAALSPWEKFKLSFSLLWTGLTMLDKDEMKAEIEKMKESDVLTEAIREFGKEFPSLIGPLLTERDQFMVHVMRRVAPRATRVVAVVGAGHLDGIRSHWEAEIDVEEICRVPLKRPARKWGRIVLLTATGAAVVYGATRWRRR